MYLSLIEKDILTQQILYEVYEQTDITSSQSITALLSSAVGCYTADTVSL
jgi:hypothetical protein